MDFLGGRARGPKKAVVTTTTTRVRAVQAQPRPNAGIPSRNSLSADIRARIARDKKHSASSRPAKRQRPAPAAEHAVERQKSPQSVQPADIRARFTYDVPRDVGDEPGYDPVPRDMRSNNSDRHISAAELVRTSQATYRNYFSDIDAPLVTLEYPADAREEYLLLTPDDPDEYDPIAELLNVVRVVATHYVPPEQQPLFGLDEIDAGPKSDLLAAARATPEDGEPILRSFSKARNRRNGALFVSTVERYNSQIRQLRDSGLLCDTITRVGKETGVPSEVWKTMQEQVYSRVVAAHVDRLKRYEAFSDNVYGEMLPPFLSEISREMSLGPESVFVDLGSGIGNLLLQVSMQTGCDAYGCEVMEAPAELAHAQVLQATARWRMWGLKGGKHIESWCADFTESDKVRAVLRDADVVLVNNYAFSPRTNDTLSLLFLDLKDGARIVSLRRFVPHDFRLTERTLSSPMAILSVEERSYSSGCVSWTAGGGKYYVHTVDRSHIRAFAGQMEDGTS
ncbi:[histone H3]-lysine(4) N-trimethyltransferase [Malassezia cuniculi]|uniref:Histone-lysine N-methyltransferase, H3 lysine-79 specific n=1 Tax=Malassezia cuniculi TaxID=948313 RepID=A0AAF0ERX2_9BASI|nr:[histone H3]-lysine(4) N-trimethyltransferase [Malassezia cuniculi]